MSKCEEVLLHPGQHGRGSSIASIALLRITMHTIFCHTRGKMSTRHEHKEIHDRQVAGRECYAIGTGLHLFRWHLHQHEQISHVPQEQSQRDG